MQGIASIGKYTLCVCGGHSGFCYDASILKRPMIVMIVGMPVWVNTCCAESNTITETDIKRNFVCNTPIKMILRKTERQKKVLQVLSNIKG